jgi:transcriptional regulator of arginine metabolism
MAKQDRQRVLLKMISSGHVANQSTLVAGLRSAGFSVTQASVSRDLEEMGIAKRNGVYRLARPVGTNDLDRVIFETAGDNLIVGHCASGMASAVTVRIDASSIDDIAGTIAGDDTIFIAVRERGAQTSVIERLGQIFPGAA